MTKTALISATLLAALPALSPAAKPFVIRDDISLPKLVDFRPLPPEDEAFSAELEEIVSAVGLDTVTPAADNPDEEDEWSSICVVDLRNPGAPRVAGWKADNFVYPASTYKMYVMGELVRQVVDGEKSLSDPIIVKEHNVRDGDRLTSGQQISLGEVLRLTIQYSDNTAANEAIDAADRQRVSAMLHALGAQGSEVTRKYLPRSREDEGYSDIVSTVTSARHLATFLWATETGALGGGKGRGLIKGYLALNDKGRIYKGLPESATIYSKTGWWNIFTSEAALVEDGETRYILCVLTAKPADVADPALANLGREVHAWMQKPTKKDSDAKSK